MTLTTIVAFIFALGVLITVHEFGHFWVARRCGVKVLRFSVGFGKPLFMRRDRHGTEFAVAAIPLGGYVRMVDEREGQIDEADIPYAFNRKPVWQRIAIVAAGPLINLIFAVVVYAGLFFVGQNVLPPVVGQVMQGSIAEAAGVQVGDEMVAVDGRATDEWEAVTLAVVKRVGDTGDILLDVKREGSDLVQRLRLPVESWLSDEVKDQTPMMRLGLRPVRRAAEIGELLEGGAALTSGQLQVGDKITAIDREAIDGWVEMSQALIDKPNQMVLLEVDRAGSRFNVEVTLGSREVEGKLVGMLGIAPAPFGRFVSYGPIDSLVKGVERTVSFIRITLISVVKMITGEISLKHVGGPITIATVAGDSASVGWQYYMGFLAMLSVSLGVLNLLPIPMLDGGHLLFYFVEIVKGSPVSQAAQELGMRIGIVILMGFMSIAFYNDIVRLIERLA